MITSHSVKKSTQESVNTQTQMAGVLSGPTTNFTFGAGLVMGMGQNSVRPGLLPFAPGFTEYFGIGTPQIGINHQFTFCLNCSR
jgi:hypothetical protein